MNESSREKLILGNLPAFPDPAERYPPETEEWAARITLRTHYAIEHVQEHGIGELVKVLLYAMPHKPWDRFPRGSPYHDVDLYFKEISGLDWDGVRAMVASISEPKAKQLDVFRAQTQAEHRPQGRHRDSAHVAASNMTKGSTNASHLLRRLARLRPDILAAYERGEFSTPTAAARAAGFKVEPSSLQKLRSAWKHASEADRKAFLEELERQ